MKDGSKKYFIRQYSQQSYMHGGVGYVDAETILSEEGYEAIEFPMHQSFSLVAKIARFLHLFKIASRTRQGDTVVFLFPVYARIVKVLLQRLLRKKVDCICFVADINGIKDADEEGLQNEIRFLRQFRKFIVHNQGMEAWLKKQIPNATCAAIDFFDFLAAPVHLNRTQSLDVIFAGNLEKSPFLEKLHLLKSSNPSLQFHLYGPGHTPAMITQENVVWQGEHEPHKMPSILKGSFGLVWDDACIDAPCGGYGDYMPYISHHKLSLYILARVPLIVPAIAGSAPLVEKYKIGILINNLYEISGKLRSITPELYLQMQQNMDQLAAMISTGMCLRKALEKMVK